MLRKQLTLIRHGHPVNDERGDPCLSEDGIRQAAAISGTFDLIILSPLRRAIETYTRSQVSGKRIVISPLMREQQDLKMYNQLRCEAPTNETQDEMYQRLTTFRTWLVEQPETNICIFSSAFAIGYLHHVFGLPSKPLCYTEIVHLEL